MSERVKYSTEEIEEMVKRGWLEDRHIDLKDWITLNHTCTRQFTHVLTWEYPSIKSHFTPIIESIVTAMDEAEIDGIPDLLVIMKDKLHDHFACHAMDETEKEQVAMVVKLWVGVLLNTTQYDELMWLES
jgi:hypothetical protein